MLLQYLSLFLTNPVELYWKLPSGKKEKILIDLLAKWRKVCAPYNLPHGRYFLTIKRASLLLAISMSVTKNKKEETRTFARFFFFFYFIFFLAGGGGGGVGGWMVFVSRCIYSLSSER